MAATNWTPIGIPSSPRPIGSEIAGWPVTLNGAVNAEERPARCIMAFTSVVSSQPSGGAGSAMVGVTKRSCSTKIGAIA